MLSRGTSAAETTQKVFAMLAGEHGFESPEPTELGHIVFISNHRVLVAKGEAKTPPGSSQASKPGIHRTNKVHGGQGLCLPYVSSDLHTHTQTHTKPHTQKSTFGTGGMFCIIRV